MPTPQWYAVYTRARHEKAVYCSLQQKAIEGFLPYYDVLSQWKDRRKWVQKPLFPGYLFVRALLTRLDSVRNIRGVVHVVGNGAEPVPVPDKQVEGIRQMVEAPMRVDPWPHMDNGEAVRVRSGPLIGLEGFVVRRGKSHRLVISVDLLGRSVSTEIDAECVELVRAKTVCSLEQAVGSGIT